MNGKKDSNSKCNCLCNTSGIKDASSEHKHIFTTMPQDEVTKQMPKDTKTTVNGKGQHGS